MEQLFLVVGSSLFNILAVLGVVGIVGPNRFDHDVIERDYPLMLGLVVLFYLVTRRIPPKDSIVFAPMGRRFPFTAILHLINLT